MNHTFGGLGSEPDVPAGCQSLASRGWHYQIGTLRLTASQSPPCGLPSIPSGPPLLTCPRQRAPTRQSERIGTAVARESEAGGVSSPKSEKTKPQGAFSSPIAMRAWHLASGALPRTQADDPATVTATYSRFVWRLRSATTTAIPAIANTMVSGSGTGGTVLPL